jgi:hypothetical protein
MPWQVPSKLTNLGLGRSSKPSAPSSSISRAQNLSTTQLQQHKDRKKATTSIGRAIRRDSGSAPSTSISHPGGYAQDATTSINHQQGNVKRSVNEQAGYDEQAEADNRRYSYMQRRIRARKAKARIAEAKEAKKVEKEVKKMTTTSSGKHKLSVGAGGTFTKGGSSGLHRRLGKFFKKHRDTYKNVSKSDRDFFEGLLTEQASKKRTGTSYGFREKKAMKSKVNKAWRSGQISKQDASDFKNIIGNLDK